jgi:hypothetical protein
MSDLFALNEGWVFSRFPGEGAVVYHPFSGDLHALSEVSAIALAVLHDKPAHFRSLADDMANSCSSASPSSEELRMILESLCEAGVVCRCPIESVSTN